MRRPAGSRDERAAKRRPLGCLGSNSRLSAGISNALPPAPLVSRCSQPESRRSARPGKESGRKAATPALTNTQKTSVDRRSAAAKRANRIKNYESRPKGVKMMRTSRLHARPLSNCKQKNRSGEVRFVLLFIRLDRERRRRKRREEACESRSAFGVKIRALKHRRDVAWRRIPLPSGSSPATSSAHSNGQAGDERKEGRRRP